jgi:hypothetical protein
MADVRRFSDAEINRLIRFYEQAEREILDRINRALLRGNQTEYLAAMKKNVEAILQQLREGNRTWCTEAIPRVYSQGLYSADAMLKDVGASVKAGFGAIHQQAAQVLAENAYQRFEDVVQVIGRQVNDIYRELALENVRGSVVGYDTWKQTAKRFREQLAERGVTGFKDRSGRMWNMRTYTKMVARTTTMEAHLQGTANRLVEQGHDLIKVSTHRGACPLCTPFEGKILSITGKTPGYPTLEEARAAGLFHPNCRHAYGLYIDLDKEIEELETELEAAETTPSFPSVPKKTLERAMHDPDYLSKQLNASHGDIVLQDMAKEVGFDKKPTLLSKEEMDAYIQQGNIEIFRGIGGRQGEAERYVEQFKTGEYFAGKGVYGNGIYTAYGEDGMEVAKQFAGGVEKNVLRISLKKDAKIISYDALIEMQKLEFTALQDEERALRRKARKEADRIYDETEDDDKVEMFLKEAAKKWEEMERYRQVLADLGRYALYKGYDAIDIPSSRFMVVLNRGKVFVQK